MKGWPVEIPTSSGPVDNGWPKDVEDQMSVSTLALAIFQCIWPLAKLFASSADGTETVAVPFKPEENLYKLYGYKWFSSATDSDITVTLARAYDQDNNVFNNFLIPSDEFLRS